MSIYLQLIPCLALLLWSEPSTLQQPSVARHDAETAQAAHVILRAEVVRHLAVVVLVVVRVRPLPDALDRCLQADGSKKEHHIRYTVELFKNHFMNYAAYYDTVQFPKQNTR